MSNAPTDPPSDFVVLLPAMMQSVVRYALTATAGYLGYKIAPEHLEGAVAIGAGLLVTAIALVWSYANKKTLLHTDPKSNSSPS